MNPLISTNQLQELLKDNVKVLICDCRFDLTQASAGRAAYAAGHIDGAIHVNLKNDLSGIQTGANGRHPLPDAVEWAGTRQRLGIDSATHVIAYDSHGSVYASRLWWMLRAIDHDKVQVLDGGLESWSGKIGTAILAPTPLEKQPESRQFEGLILVDEILNNLASQRKTIVDARSPDRFHGRFYKCNLEDGAFKSPDILRNEFFELLGNIRASDVVHSCGSGVTACHNLLAMEYAGLSGSHLYAGSWSEWCADPNRPVEI
jgi:thiosulfate/3-mercaptopyruvate sulfurtransferase